MERQNRSVTLSFLKACASLGLGCVTGCMLLIRGRGGSVDISEVVENNFTGGVRTCGTAQKIMY
jgi:hypothetical protein